MTLFFIEENKEKNKLKYKINSILNKIEERTDGNKVFLYLPINSEKCKGKKIKKIVAQMEKYKIKTAILSENLYNVQTLKNELYSKNINILDGKYLFKLLTQEIIKYICKKMNTNMEKIEVSFLINQADNIDKQIIVDLAEKVKTINIITNHKNEFKNLEDYLYNEKGIIVKISNNTKTALQKTNIIVNFDFPQEIINEYSIPNKCIIINTNGGIKIKTKKFDGMNVNGYNITIPPQYKIEGYNNNHIYEAKLLFEDYQNAVRHIQQDKIKIKNLIGEKGIISNNEV